MFTGRPVTDPLNKGVSTTTVVTTGLGISWAVTMTNDMDMSNSLTVTSAYQFQRSCVIDVLISAGSRTYPLMENTYNTLDMGICGVRWAWEVLGKYHNVKPKVHTQSPRTT